MLILPYNPDKHQSKARLLLLHRNMDINLVNDLPEHGLIAIKDGIPIAMGFIRRIEGEYAMLDSYITDPKAAAPVRDRALETIGRKLIDMARNGGCKTLLAFSTDAHILARGVRWGFVPLEHKFMAKAL